MQVEVLAGDAPVWGWEGACSMCRPLRLVPSSHRASAAAFVLRPAAAAREPPGRARCTGCSVRPFADCWASWGGTRRAKPNSPRCYTRAKAQRSSALLGLSLGQHQRDSIRARSSEPRSLLQRRQPFTCCNGGCRKATLDGRTERRTDGEAAGSHSLGCAGCASPGHGGTELPLLTYPEVAPHNPVVSLSLVINSTVG